MTLHTTYEESTDRYAVSDETHELGGLTRDEYQTLMDDYRGAGYTADELFAAATSRHQAAPD